MRKILSTILLATLVLSVVAVAGVVPVRAAVVGTLEVSTTQFWKNQVVQIKVTDPDMNINATGYDTLTVSLYKGDTLVGPLTLNETLPNSGEFIAYLSANSTANAPAKPPYNTMYMNYSLESTSGNWTLVPGGPVTLSSGDTIKIVYNDQSPVGTISQTLTFKQYKAAASDITFDRSNNEYPMYCYMRIYIKDISYNLDPTDVDKPSFTITYTPVGGSPTSETVTFEETGPNTGIFKYQKELNATSLSSGTPIEVKYNGPLSTPSQYITVKKYTPSLRVDGTFTAAGDLTITVVDPNANLKSWEAETIGDYNTVTGNANVTIKTDKGDGTTVDKVVLTSDFEEDDTNSGTFTYTVPVTIGTVDTTDGTIQLTVNDTKVYIYYYVKGAEAASTVSTWSKTAAQLSIDKTQYRSTDKVKITLAAPDLNTDSSAINFVTQTVNQYALLNYDNLYFQMGNNVVGKMTVLVNGLAANASSAITVTFLESGANTGTFTYSLDLTKIKKNDGSSIANGDTLTIKYYDAINDVTSTATATIGVTAASISLDRTTLPPVVGTDKIKLYVTANDPESNKNTESIDKVTGIMYSIYFYNGTIVRNGTIDLSESDANTGIFKGTITIDPTGFSLNQEVALIGGWVTVQYPDPASGKNITATSYFKATDASISVDKSTATFGDKLTITVVDPDANRDSKSAESVTVLCSFTNLTGSDDSKSFTLDETDVNTGTFQATITLGKDLYVKPGTTMTFSYDDGTPSYITAATGFPSTAVEKDFDVNMASSTGKVYTDKAEYGYGSKMVITVVDPDLNTDIYSKQSVDVIVRISGQPDQKVTLTEADLSSSIFNGTFKWGTDLWPSVAVKDLLGKTFYIYYKDVADASGNTVYQSCSGQVKSWDGAVTFDKSYYDVGDMATVTVNDPDANVNPDMLDTVQVTVYSSSDPVGQTLTATETGENTGVFTTTVQVSSSIATGKVYAKYGDTLTASYKDNYPADYADTEKPKTFTGTAIVGVPVARPVPASSQKFVDPNTGAEKTSGTVGQAIGLQATVKNVDVVSKTFTAIFKVKDASGVTISISWVTGTLAPGQELTPGVSWTPSAAGTYTVEVLVVKTLAEPTPYSDIQTKTLTVS